MSNGFVHSVKEKNIMMFVLKGKKRGKGGGDDCIVGIQRQMCFVVVRW